MKKTFLQFLFGFFILAIGFVASNYSTKVNIVKAAVSAPPTCESYLIQIGDPLTGYATQAECVAAKSVCNSSSDGQCVGKNPGTGTCAISGASGICTGDAGGPCTCVNTCPSGSTFDSGTGRCECTMANGSVYGFTPGQPLPSQCTGACPAGSTYNSNVNACECKIANGSNFGFPPGQALPSQCVTCPAGSTFDSGTNRCECTMANGSVLGFTPGQTLPVACQVCSPSSDGQCVGKAPGAGTCAVNGASGICSGSAGGTCTCQPTATIAPGTCSAASDGQCAGKQPGLSTACTIAGGGSGFCQQSSGGTGSCVCQPPNTQVCSGPGTSCLLSGANSCQAGYSAKGDPTCTVSGQRCCPTAVSRTCWSNTCDSITFTDYANTGCPADHPLSAKPASCGGGGPTCTQPGVACSTATSDNGNCCAGSYCQGPAGSQRCETPTGDVCPGGGVCGGPQGYIAFKCTQLTNGECLENPSTFDSYTAARTYAGTCGQVDTTCVGGTNNRHLCGAFEIISSGCSGGGGSPGPSPTPGVTPTPGPICASIASSNPAPQVGDTVKFTCGLVNGAEHYEFRVKTPAGTIQTLAADVTSPSKNVSQSLLIDTAGSYSAQCRICTGATTCQAWETL